jgi:hypothetical protein
MTSESRNTGMGSKKLVTTLGRQHEMTAPRTVTKMNGMRTKPTTNETQPAPEIKCGR